MYVHWNKVQISVAQIRKTNDIMDVDNIPCFWDWESAH